MIAAGEKPLFYHHEKGTLRFASELKALLADASLPRVVDLESLDCFLAMGHVPGERCILRGFRKLPPAHALRFDLRTGTAKVWRYWGLPELDPAAEQGSVNEPALLDELEFLLSDSVRHQLIADVPVGVLLSGGVDSSLITAMAVRSHDEAEDVHDPFSRPWQPRRDRARTPDRAGVRDRARGAGGAVRHGDLLPRLARQFDEPMLDSSMIPTFLV